MGLGLRGDRPADRWYDLEVHVIKRVLAVAALGGTATERWESRLSTATALALPKPNADRLRHRQTPHTDYRSPPS